MARFGKFLINLAAIAALGIGRRLGSAWYIGEAGSRLTTRGFGPWITWIAVGRVDGDPYTRAHTARNGLLPIASTLELTYYAKTDAEGGQLQSACVYSVTVQGLDGRWWNLAAFDRRGGLIANMADRYAFSSDNAMREPDGRAVIVVARDARPGNWLPIGAGKVTLVLTIQDAVMAAAVTAGGSGKALPVIRKIGCR